VAVVDSSSRHRTLRVQSKTSHLRVSDDAAGRVWSLIQFGPNAQTGRRRGVIDDVRLT